jgi:hypothetical protein
VWEASEYGKLPPFDGETFEQPPEVFMCHQQDGRLCAGWVAVHDMSESLGLRLVAQQLSEEEVTAILVYETDVPLFSSGAEACAHGLSDLDTPGDDARAMVAKLSRRLDDG